MPLHAGTTRATKTSPWLYPSFTWIYWHMLVVKFKTSLVAQTVKHLPTTRKTQVQSLGQEDPLEKEMATHSSTLAWKIPWTKDPGRLQSMGPQRVGHDGATSLSETLKQEQKCCYFSPLLIPFEMCSNTFLLVCFNFNIYLFWLCRVSAAVHSIFGCSMWDLDQGWNLGPLYWERSLTSGPLGKSLTLCQSVC